MRSLGGQYEEKAAAYLAGLGYRIVERNFTIRGGELDIVARDGGCIVFVEVKARKNLTFGSALSAVTQAKQRKIVKTAIFYLKEKGIKPKDVRFDVLGMTETADGIKYELVKNAFYAQGYYL